MIIKIINNLTISNSLVFTFLVFRAYFYTLKYDFLILAITHHVVTIRNWIKEIRKVKAKIEIADTLTKKNNVIPIVFVIYNLPLGLDIFV